MDKKRPKKKPPTEKELANQLKQAEEIHKKLDDMLQNTYKASGLTPKQITEYLDNPNNFNQSQWQIIQAQRDYFKNSLIEQLDPDYQEKLEKREQKKKGRKLRGRAMGKKKKWFKVD